MYKITRQIADLIGRFEHSPNEFFDPYTCEQEDGTFVVNEDIIQRLKNHPKVASINWDEVQIITELNNKDKSGQNVKKP